MFGYIIPNFSILNEEQKARFRSAYCGLCYILQQRHGQFGSATLSYDLTFMAMLLQSLYEPEEEYGSRRCIAHPIKRHSYEISEPFAYVADMNVALAYHKCMDNWLDDKNAVAVCEAALLYKSYRRVLERYPSKCRAIEAWLDEIHQIERRNDRDIDAPVNSTGRMLGELFCYKSDFWANSLRLIGDALGRFIYLMDAYDDLSKDIRYKRYNPLKSYREDEFFEQMCREAMVSMVADATHEFELLPLERDIDILRNVMYSGIWSKYSWLQNKKHVEKEKKHAGSI